MDENKNIAVKHSYIWLFIVLCFINYDYPYCEKKCILNDRKNTNVIRKVYTFKKNYSNINYLFQFHFDHIHKQFSTTKTFNIP